MKVKLKKIHLYILPAHFDRQVKPEVVKLSMASLATNNCVFHGNANTETGLFLYLFPEVPLVLSNCNSLRSPYLLIADSDFAMKLKKIGCQRFCEPAGAEGDPVGF